MRVSPRSLSGRRFPPLPASSAQDEAYEEVKDWEWLVSMWGVRFPFAVGSACFVVGALLSLPEVLSD